MSIRQRSFRELLVSTAVVLAMTSASFLACPASAEPIEVSTDLEPMAVERLGAGTVLGDDGQIYVFGGYRYNYTAWDFTTNTVLIYNITTGETTYGASMSHGAAWPSCAKLPDGRMVVVGGYDSSVVNGTDSVRIYDPQTHSWTTNTSAPINISRASTAIAENGTVYLFGPTDSQNSTLIYDPVADSWSYGADLPGGRSRYSSSAVVYNDTAIYVMGGFHFELIWVIPGVWVPIFYDTDYVDIYNPVTDSWTSGPSLNRAKLAGGAAVARDGCIHFYGGQGQMMSAAYDEIEVLDPSQAGATWQMSNSTISNVKAHFGTVADDLGRVFLVGGLELPAFLGVADVEMLIATEVSEVNEIVITNPEEGAAVNGTVEIRSEAKNLHDASVVVIDTYVDDVLLESQLGEGATEWTFKWNASGLALNSSHDILVRAFFSDGTVSEDEVTCVVAEMIPEEDFGERLLAIEEDLAAVLSALAGMAGDIQDIENVTSALSSALAELSADLDVVASDLQSALSDLASLLSSIDALESQLNLLSDELAELGDTSDADLAALAANLSAAQDAIDDLALTLTAVQSALEDLAQQPGLDTSDIMEQLEDLQGALEDLNQTVQDIDGSDGTAQTSDDNAEAYAMLAMVLAAVVLAVLVVSMVMSRRKP
jgi:N-acetylneuraminic acid mutarotase/archaellum component FlaC